MTFKFETSNLFAYSSFRYTLIDIFAVTNLDYVDDKNRILDRVENSKSTLAEPITLKAGQLQRTRWPWIFSERFDALNDTSPIRLCGDRFQFFARRLPYSNVISCHVVSSP